MLRLHEWDRPLACLPCMGLLLLMTGCKMPGEQQDFSKLTDEFVYGSLALSPVSATIAGLPRTSRHPAGRKAGRFQSGGIQEQRQFFSGFHERLALIKPETLAPEDRADYQIVQNQVELSLLDLNRIQSFRHNPTVYVELAGNALFNPFVLEYAPLETRYRHIIQRLFKVPELCSRPKRTCAMRPTFGTALHRRRTTAISI